MFEIVIFLVSVLIGMFLMIKLTTGKTTTEVIDCIESIFNYGSWSSR